MDKFIQKINAAFINKRTSAISNSLAANFDKLLLDGVILDYSRFCCTCGHLTHIQHYHMSLNVLLQRFQLDTILNGYFTTGLAVAWLGIAGEPFD